MNESSNDDLQDQFVEAWVATLTTFVRAAENLTSREQRRRAKPREYEALLEAAIDFTKCERHYLQLGCKVPETPSDPDYAGLLTLIDNARELAGAMPPDATKQVETLFKRHLVSLVSTLRKRELQR